MLAVVGLQWISVDDGQGDRRLEDPRDYVRLAAGMGLRPKMPVVPLLVDGARMTSEDELPDDLKTLGRRDAIELRRSQFDAEI